MNLTESMRQDWDERARKDAFHYIASWRKDWDEKSFFESGEKDYQQLVAPALERLHWDPHGKTMLELGCGAGRMTRSFAKLYSRVYAFDISAEMLKYAKALLPEVSNIEWILSNGIDLSNLADGTVDFAFSYIVLQHMPASEFARRYIRELLRVLKPDGAFLFQFNSLQNPTMNWRGQMAWRLVDLPWSFGLRVTSRSIASLLGLSPEIAGKSWRGVSLDVENVRRIVQSVGGIVREVNGEGTAMTWCSGIKSKVLNL